MGVPDERKTHIVGCVLLQNTILRILIQLCHYSTTLLTLK